MSPLPTFYTTDQVAASLNCSVWKVRKFVKDGVVNPMRLSNSRTAEMRFDDEDVALIAKALRSNTGGAIPTPPAVRRRRRRVAS